jgi:hypothetical protein
MVNVLELNCPSSEMMELKSVFDSLGSACCSIALPAADFCSGGAWAILVCLKFSFGLQLFFNEARPACILCFAIAENVFYQFPGSISKKNYNKELPIYKQ